MENLTSDWKIILETACLFIGLGFITLLLLSFWWLSKEIRNAPTYHDNEEH